MTEKQGKHVEHLNGVVYSERDTPEREAGTEVITASPLSGVSSDLL